MHDKTKLSEFSIEGKKYLYHDLKAFSETKGLPRTLRILFENVLRCAPEGLADFRCALGGEEAREIFYQPTRILMQDMTGIPALVDLAAMRDFLEEHGKDPLQINPKKPVDLVIDHSSIVDFYGTSRAFSQNQEKEFERNRERYQFLKWAQKSFKNLRIVPPGMGICHQINVEYLAQVVWAEETEQGTIAFPDTVIGTDSHTTMVSGLGVLGWGVGGIEAEASMLGQPVSIRMPEVLGVRLEGDLPEGVTATDLVLHITERLRKKGVVGKFVEFFGPGLRALSLADRATISNMSPEFGATCAYFPVDEETIRYLRLTGRSDHQCALVETYAKCQGLWHDAQEVIKFSEEISLDMGSVSPSLAGPKRPQDRVTFQQVKENFKSEKTKSYNPVFGKSYGLRDGCLMIAAITGCTNTSNPSVMIAAGLLAKKAVEKGLSVPDWVKTSLAPGSQVVTDYLEKAGLQKYLDTLGFCLVGYVCTTCIGNSGPIEENLSQCIQENNLNVASVLSGNRNFEGRINPDVQSNYLASPPLVVAYALAGCMDMDISKDPLGVDRRGAPVYLKDIWPSNLEIQEVMSETVSRDLFCKRYDSVELGTDEWQKMLAPEGDLFPWEAESTYIQKPPFLEVRERGIQDIKDARVLGLFGDSVTTDHISPAGIIPVDSAAGKHLMDQGVKPEDFNSYGSRRGNHEVMMRGGFANIRIKNHINPEKTGGYTRICPGEDLVSVFDAAMKYGAQGTPLVVMGGAEYGTGSSRDWAAKAPNLLGIKSVISESYERIHRSNLIGMGVLPLEFLPGESWKSLGIGGEDKISILGLEEKSFTPGCLLKVLVEKPCGEVFSCSVRNRIDTEMEMSYYRQGGILPYVVSQYL